MDIGMFKASRGRLAAWIVLPPVLAVAVGLGAYALERQAYWNLARLRGLSDTLPQLGTARTRARVLLDGFQGGQGRLLSEDQYIAYLQQAARQTGFTIDSLKVDRLEAGKERTLPVLSASLKGAASMETLEAFMAEVSAGQHLLSESSVKLVQAANAAAPAPPFRAELVFDLVLFRTDRSPAGGVQ